MKTMTCKQLGGPCDLEHHGQTADEVIKAQDRHLKDVVAAGDAAHESAFKDMRKRWRHPIANMGWYKETKREFAALVGGLTPSGAPAGARRRSPGAGGQLATKQPASVVTAITPPSAAEPGLHCLAKRLLLPGRRVLTGRRRGEEGDHVGRVGADHGARVRAPGDGTEGRAQDRLAGRAAETGVQGVQGGPAEGVTRQVRQGAQVGRPVGRRQKNAAGPQHTAERRHRPRRVGDVVQHVIGHHHVECVVAEGQVHRVAGEPPTSANSRSGPTAEAAASTMPSERSVRVKRRWGSNGGDVDPQRARAAADLEHPPTLGPVDLTDEPLVPGHLGPRVLGVQSHAAPAGFPESCTGAHGGSPGQCPDLPDASQVGS